MEELKAQQAAIEESLKDWSVINLFNFLPMLCFYSEQIIQIVCIIKCKVYRWLFIMSLTCPVSICMNRTQNAFVEENSKWYFLISSSDVLINHLFNESLTYGLWRDDAPISATDCWFLYIVVVLDYNTADLTQFYFKDDAVQA